LKVKQYLVVLLLLLCAVRSRAQTIERASPPAKINQASDKLLTSLDGNATWMQLKLKAGTQKFLRRIATREKKIWKKLYKTDTARGQRMASLTDSTYAALNRKMQEGSGNDINPFSNVYSSKLDSLRTAITYLKQNGSVEQSVTTQQQYQALLGKYNGLQDKFNQTETINQYLTERQEALNHYLSNVEYIGAYKKLQQDILYYRQQITQYKEIWEDPSKMEKQLMALLSKVPQFRQFFDRYSDLGAVFQLPGNSTGQAAANGMQTRAVIDQFIQQNRGMSRNVQSQIQTSLPDPRDQLDAMKNRLASLGATDGAAPQPDFKPNDQRTKSFFRRLEYGTSVQSVKANYFFPATTDIGLSVGYKLNDKSVIGVGGSGKLGWGKSIQHINVTGEGMSLRSFLDVKLKGSFWLSGGWEYNYQQPFTTDQDLKDVNNWKSSGLMGLTKTLALKSKGFKKYRIQLLYDFLHQQTPYTAPVKCRVGYSF
jgi:hypothetical protein